MSPRRPGAAPPIGFAHRGARAERPDNTLAGFARALDLGASGLESDAWVTADGVAVLDHDGVLGPLRRLSGLDRLGALGPLGRLGRLGRRPIADVARAALPGHVPSLPELYQACGSDYQLSLDVKDPRALPAVLGAATAARATDRLWLCHSDPAVLAGWRPSVGAARLVLSTRVRTLPVDAEGRARVLAERAGAGVDALNLHRSEWSGALVEQVHRAGLAAFAWDAQTAPDVARLVDWGLDGIYSDHVATLMAAITGAADEPA